MSTRHPLSIHHAIPGRLRLGVEPLRGKPAEAERVAESVRALPGVREVRANAGAACLVVTFDPKITFEDLMSRLGGVAELFRWGIHEVECAPTSCTIPSAAHPPPRAALAILETASRVNATSREVAAGHADLKLVIPGLLAGFGLLRLVTGRYGPTPHWVVFLMYGFDAFAVLNQAVIRRFIEASPPAVPVK
jgi:hypothetical protein